MLVEPKSPQLLDRDDTVLTSRKRCNLPVGVGAQVAHIATNAPDRR
jgi:hypothetical protein